MLLDALPAWQEAQERAQFLLPAAQAIPIAAVAIGYRAWARFRSYLLTLDLRLVLAAQPWRVIGIAFLFVLAFGQLPAGFAVPAAVGDLATGIAALAVVQSLGNGTLTRGRLYAFTALGVADFLVADATGLSLEPPALTAWPLAIFPTLMIPFFAVLHLVIPSMPSYGFSGPTREPGWTTGRVARAWAELMARLGDQRYGAQGATGARSSPPSSAASARTTSSAGTSTRPPSGSSPSGPWIPRSWPAPATPRRRGWSA